MAKDLGVVTSYGYAKSTGRLPAGMTEEEYAEKVADFALAAQTAVDARDAARAAQSAAETAEGNAETAATQAAGSATTASGAAATAAQKAGEASTYASNAGASASQAQTYASNAEQSATAASGSASAASGSASAAAGSASAAHTSETNAAESETAAAESAAQAKEAARTLTIDPTLTQPGQAAEAKATGDAVAELKSHFDEIMIETTPVYLSGWLQGYIRPSNGTIGTSHTHCVTGWLTFANGPVNIEIKSGYVIDIAQYLNTAGTHGTFDKHIVRDESGATYSFNADASKFYKIDIRKTDTSAMAPADVPADAVLYYHQYFTDKTLTMAEKAADAKATGEAIHKNYVGGNALDQTTLTLDAFIRNDNGTQGSSTSYAVTDYIPVSTGDTVAASYAAGAFMAMRYVTAYSEKKTLMGSFGAGNVNSYTVPSGVAYIRISADKARITSNLARISRTYVSGQKVFYEPYFDGELSEFAKSNRSAIETLKGYPLTKLPQYIINNLAYKPLGSLSKGYVCFVSDDGDAELATYTIPMFIAKGVPGTWAVMRSSTVWNSQSGIDAVIDSVQNHGCCLAQHGGSSWTQYDELSLNTFFDDEKVYWDQLGVSVYGAVCPAHDINDMIRCVAGGRFLCLRTGYDDAKPRYANYCNGPRSNLFGLCSQSSLDGTVATQSAVLDMCKENHWLRILHFHENEMDANARARLEAIIDYAKSIELTFVTMQDIPWLI